MAQLAAERGHQVTCLARGVSGRVPDGTELVVADRWQPDAYDGVRGRRFDSVLDVSWQPELVRSAVRALGGRSGHWVYVSSLSVYADETVAGQDESAAVQAPWSGSGTAAVADYAAAKVACERACTDSLGAERVVVARAGLIAGYGDRSDRFGYWPGRVALALQRGDTVLVPPRAMPTQLVDVADLAAWLVHCVEERLAGAYNVVGDVTPFGSVLDACAEAAGGAPDRLEVDDAFLLGEGVTPWMGDDSLPLWLPAESYPGFSTRTNDAARGAGLALSALRDTAARSLRWEQHQGLERPRRAGLSRDRERALLRRARTR